MMVSCLYGGFRSVSRNARVDPEVKSMNLQTVLGARGTAGGTAVMLARPQSCWQKLSRRPALDGVGVGVVEPLDLVPHMQDPLDPSCSTGPSALGLRGSYRRDGREAAGTPCAGSN